MLWQEAGGAANVLAVALDSIYQLIVHRGVYFPEPLITATVLAIVLVFRLAVRSIGLRERNRFGTRHRENKGRRLTAKSHH